MTGQIVDTALNVMVFLYIGGLIWLCFRADP